MKLEKCRVSNKSIPKGRSVLGYKVCIEHVEAIAKERVLCVAPMHKSNYVLVSDRRDLIGLNNKGGLVK